MSPTDTRNLITLGYIEVALLILSIVFSVVNHGEFYEKDAGMVARVFATWFLANMGCLVLMMFAAALDMGSRR